MSYCPVHDLYVTGTLPTGATACKDCYSIACFLSKNYVKVGKWKCYQKKYENSSVID